ncbi:MAG: hypothetical protein KC442_17375 [Thermomicrobiales bacterium]|nr:hypothetical protein [Thermomicrobiales bacterium]
MEWIDDGAPLVTLMVAPAGFGKTIAAAEWARRSPEAAWLTVDAGDAVLERFWAYLREALQHVAPAFGHLVTHALTSPQRPPAEALGQLLADELLDATAPVRLVIDDLHTITPGEVHAFLQGLLEAFPPALQLVITSRIDLPFSLERARLRGVVRDLRSADLLFSEGEARALVAHIVQQATHSSIDTLADALLRETHGWPAGAHLRALAFRHETELPDVTHEQTTATESQLLGLLLNDILSGLSAAERCVLLRSALPEAVTPQLMAALAYDHGASTALGLSSLILFAQATDLWRPSARFGGDWLEFHPLFREILQRQLAQEASAEEIRDLHRRIADWLEAVELTEAAIPHRVAAGHIDAAVALVEQAVEPAFARENWAAVAKWLALVPDDIVRQRPELLVSRAWVTHLRGQALYQHDLLHVLRSRIDQGDLEEARKRGLQAEMDLLAFGSLVPIQVDPGAVTAITRQAITHIPSTNRFPHGFGWGILGLALQAAGRREEAVELLTAWAESTPDHADAASVRGLLGLLFVYTQAGDLETAANVAHFTLDITERHGLRLTAGWAHRFLGDILYEQDDLDGACAHYTAMIRDHEFAHLTALRAAMLGLAMSHHALGQSADAWRTLRRCRDIISTVNALEHLPALAADEAYLALRDGQTHQALSWARSHQPEVDSTSLHLLGHPAYLRAMIFSTTGTQPEQEEAIAILSALRDRATRAHFAGPLVRFNALAAVALIRQGAHEMAVRLMRQSLAVGMRRGFNRTYLDLLPGFAEEMTALAADVTFPATVLAALNAPEDDSHTAIRMPPAPSVLTRREQEMLQALSQRLSYKEIAEQFFISPLTVKSHASNIYSKLGATGRIEAIRIARDMELIP